MIIHPTREPRRSRGFWIFLALGLSLAVIGVRAELTAEPRILFDAQMTTETAGGSFEREVSLALPTGNDQAP